MSTAQVYRYFQAESHDHFYTTNAGEIGTTAPGQKGNHGYTSEGVAFSVYTEHHHGTVPVYRYWNANTKDHFYTTNAAEIGTTHPGHAGNHGYVSEGILGYVFQEHVHGSVPIYRYWHAGSHDHFYTTNASEIGVTQSGQTGNHGYASEGVLGYAVPGHLVPVHRYFKAETHDHFYTTKAEEIGTTTHGQKGNHGYTSEGISFWVATEHHHGLVPIYRYWKADTTDHFYTTNASEIGTTNPGQTGNHGYVSEGILGYLSPNPGNGLVPIYRYWHAGSTDHFYTANAGEIGVTHPGQTGNHGYVSEGVLGYAFH